jgi:hypothetical protein
MLSRLSTVDAFGGVNLFGELCVDSEFFAQTRGVLVGVGTPRQQESSGRG